MGSEHGDYCAEHRCKRYHFNGGRYCELCAERAQFRDENERLKALFDGTDSDWMDKQLAADSDLHRQVLAGVRAEIAVTEEIDRLKAENAELRKRIEQGRDYQLAVEQRDSAEEELSAVQAQLERAASLLAHYGNHWDRCSFHKTPLVGADCDCGLRAALEELSK
jgi:hypothetical protein